jgi:peroxisomal coenzyme A diphosphatase NUDT7
MIFQSRIRMCISGVLTFTNVVYSGKTMELQNELSNHDASDSTLDRLRKVNLAPKDQPQHKDLTRASILVPLFFRNDSNQQHQSNAPSAGQWHMLLTKRLETLRTHSGEVCFPGGKQDPEDLNDDIATALRETNEEVGIDIGHITPICRLETIESYTGLCVTPIVGIISPNAQVMDPSKLTICKDEVEVAFTVPLQYFVDDNNLSSKYDVEWRNGTFELRTYFYTSDDCNNRTFKIWGLTAYIAHQVATIAYNQ